MGTPAGLIGTTAFQGLAVSELTSLGVAGLPLLMIEHPLGGERPESVARRAQQALEQLASLIGRVVVSAGASAPAPSPASERFLEVDDDPRRCWRRSASGAGAMGFPSCRPPRRASSPCWAAARRAASLGAMPPLWRQAALEKLAVNAVMAGCEPSHFPIIVAAVEAMLDPAFNLYGVQATTHPVAPLVVVHGEYGRSVGVHAGSGCFGPGFRANATIGRAIRLDPAEHRRGLAGPPRHGHPGQPGQVLVLHRRERRGHAVGALHADDVVTVFGGEPPHNVNDHVSTTASGILTTVVDTAVSLGLERRAGSCRRASSCSFSAPSTRPPSPETVSRGAMSSSSSSSTPVFLSASSSSAVCGECTTGPRGCKRRATTTPSCPRSSRRRGLRVRGRRSGQAFRRGPQLHLQPRRHPADSDLSRFTSGERTAAPPDAPTEFGHDRIARASGARSP